MSDIYVKWKKLEGCSSDISNCGKWVDRYALKVENVKNSLQLSAEVSSSVKAKLQKDVETLNGLAASLKDYSQKLLEISNLYGSTEKSLTES